MKATKTWLVSCDAGDEQSVIDVLNRAGFKVEQADSGDCDGLLRVAGSREHPQTAGDSSDALFSATPDLVFRISRDARLVAANKPEDSAYYVPPDQFLSRHVSDVLPSDVADLIIQKIQLVLATHEVATFEYALDMDGRKRYFECRMAPSGDDVIAIVRDVTERVRAEQRHSIRAEIMRAIHHAPDLWALVRDIIVPIKQYAGCEAVGIRLKDGDDYPYWQVRGLSDDFVRAESCLIARDSLGGVIREDGNVVLECMCGKVITRQTDPSLPCFTEFGSFWTNSTTDLLAASAASGAPLGRTRNRCHSEGYETVALIPLWAGGDCYGLLHFNDSRRDFFSEQTMAELENIAECVAISIAHRLAMEALRKSQAGLVIAQRLVHLGSYEFDLTTQLGVCSAETRSILGLAGTDGPITIGMCYNYIHLDDRDAVVKAFTEAVSCEGSVDIDYRIIPADGILRYVHCVAQVTRNPKDGARTLFGTVTDITERKQFDEELARAREALETAYRREHHIADVLQRALIPDVDVQIDDCHLLACYAPALEEAEVGGDFYDVFRLPDGRTAFLMGDVSGKGLTAATHTAMVKYTIRAYAHEDPSPAHTLERVNHAISDYAVEDLFITVFYGVIDSVSGVLTYASAGHDLPLHYSKASGGTTALDVTGMAIGVTPDASYSQGILELGCGDSLVVYTDGITDARVGRDFFGLDGLSGVLTANAGESNEVIIDQILDAALDASGGKLRDDCAVMVLKRLG